MCRSTEHLHVLPSLYCHGQVENLCQFCIAISLSCERAINKHVSEFVGFEHSTLLDGSTCISTSEHALEAKLLEYVETMQALSSVLMASSGIHPPVGCSLA